MTKPALPAETIRHDQVSGGGAEDKAALDFDDDEVYSGRGKSIRSGGTANAQGGDSGRLGAPAEQLSDQNGPSDPDEQTGPRGGS